MTSLVGSATLSFLITLIARTKSVPIRVALKTSPNAPSPIFYTKMMAYISESVALEN